MLLPSGIHLAEMWFPIIPYLENDYEIVSLNYPDVSGMEEMITGIHSIVQSLGLTNFSLIGMSTSSWITQTYIKQYAESVDKVVLINTSKPEKTMVPELEEAYAAAKTDYVKLLEISHIRYYINKSENEPADLTFRGCDVLIIETKNVEGYGKNEQNNLKEIYPDAKVLHLTSGGHIPVYNSPQMIIDTLRDFL